MQYFFSAKCHIRQIGRQLGLDDHLLEVVDRYWEHGTPEMFWQLVKIWHENSPPKTISARTLKKALRCCNINIAGMLCSNATCL